MLGGGWSPLLAGLHQLLDSGYQSPLLVADLPDGHNGNTHHRGESDTPTQYIGPVGKDVTVIRAAFVVDPAEDQDQLKGKMMSKKKILQAMHTQLTTTIIGEMNIQAAFQRMRGYG